MIKDQLGNANVKGKYTPDFLGILGKYGSVSVLLLIIIVFSILRSQFLSIGNFTDVMVAATVTFLITLGIMCSLTVDGFDLSIGSTASFSGIIASSLMVIHEMPLFIVIIVPLIVGGLIGLLNALFIVKFKLPDLLVTLGMMFVVSGITLTYSGGHSIYPNMRLPSGESAPGTFLKGFSFLANGEIAGIPFPIITTVVIGIIMFYIFEKTRFGRNFYATGDNIEAARIAGIAVNKYKIAAYVLSGVMAALGGLFLASLLNIGENHAGEPYLLDTVTAVFLGFSVWGLNRANVVGTLFGAVFLAILVTGLTMLNIPYTAQDIFKGGLLLFAILFTSLSGRKVG